MSLYGHVAVRQRGEPNLSPPNPNPIPRPLTPTLALTLNPKPTPSPTPNLYGHVAVGEGGEG